MAVQIKGIDVSKYQAFSADSKSKGVKKGDTKIDFVALKKLGYEFVMIRAGLGMFESQKDYAFESHYAAAKAAGLHVGAYHYTYAVSVEEAKREAACFLKWIEGKKLDYPVAFDIEDSALKNLTTKERTDIALAFMETVEAAGYYTMLYSNPNWAKNFLDMDRLKHFDVWLACYTTEERRKELYKRDALGIWQHASDLVLDGVYDGRLDANIAYKDYAEIIKSAGLNHLTDDEPGKPAVSEYAGKYKVTGKAVNLRKSAGTSAKVIAVLVKGDVVTCDGKAVNLDGTVWLEVDFGKYHGFMSTKYLEKI